MPNLEMYISTENDAHGDTTNGIISAINSEVVCCCETDGENCHCHSLLRLLDIAKQSCHHLYSQPFARKPFVIIKPFMVFMCKSDALRKHNINGTTLKLST